LDQGKTQEPELSVSVEKIEQTLTALKKLVAQKRPADGGVALGGSFRFPNRLWAVYQFANRHKFAAKIGLSGSWLSRRLVGRVALHSEERRMIAEALGYPAEWLFQESQSPSRITVRQ
jgi:hypothetical protein